MGAAEDLMQRLAVSKKIMEKTEGIQRGSVDSRHMNSPRVEEFQPVQGNYNIPQEYLQENSTPKSSYDATKPLESDRIKNSKLPDEIKQLMIERPIIQPASSSPTISNNIIEGAQRLMNMNSSNNTQQKQPITENVKTNNVSSNINMNEMKSIIRDVVRDTVRDVVREELKDAGMLVESTTDSNEVIQFKVGKHLFVGRVTKVKKLV